MTETTTQDPQPQGLAGAQTDAVDEQLAARLDAQARSQGISLVGPDGLLQRVTKLALEGELTDRVLEGLTAWQSRPLDPGLPGAVHRRDQRQDPRRAGL